MGIEQLIDTFKGNPAPLQAKVERDNKGQPPGSVPKDLEEALALQKIAEIQRGAQNQQAIQAGGAQPSVVEKLRQMLGAMQAQSQPAQMLQQGMPQRPVMAASGGSIDQLMSNLGTNYAGGGIVAFTPGGDVEDEKLSEADAKDIERRMRERTAPTEKKESTSEYLRQMGNVLGLFGNLGSDAIKTLVSAPGYGFSSDSKPAAKPTTAPIAAAEPADIRAQLNAADAARYAERPTPVAPTPSTPRPNAGIAGAGAPTNANAIASKLDPNGLRALSEKMIREEMGLNPETESDKMVARARKLMDIDSILNEKRGRVSEFEKAVAESKASRTPEWVKALQAAGGAPVRGGIGMLLGQMGAAATKTREGYDSQDLEYKRELNRLRDVISDAQLSGNKELAKEALAAYKEVDARRKAGLTSATSLLNTDANIEASNQRAREAAASRAQIGAAQLEERKARRLQEQKNFLAQEERKWQDTLSRNPEYKKLVDARSLQERLLYMSTDPKVQEKAQEAVDMYNEKIQKMMPTAGGGTVNIPPPPKGAVTRVG